jgi:hypothetical protein
VRERRVTGALLLGAVVSLIAYVATNQLLYAFVVSVAFLLIVVILLLFGKDS